MREISLVVIVTLGMVMLSLAWTASLGELAYVAAIGLALGFGVGVPAGVIYHVLLYRALAPRGELKKGWIWHPLRYDALLKPEERSSVMFWCWLGAAGFVVLCIGLAAVFICVLRISL